MPKDDEASIPTGCPVRETDRGPAGEVKLHVDRGFERLQDKNYAEAIGYFDEAVKLDPGSARACYGRGIAWHCLSGIVNNLKDDREAYAFPNFVKELFFDSETSLTSSPGCRERSRTAASAANASRARSAAAGCCRAG